MANHTVTTSKEDKLNIDSMFLDFFSNKEKKKLQLMVKWSRMEWLTFYYLDF